MEISTDKEQRAADDSSQPIPPPQTEPTHPPTRQERGTHLAKFLCSISLALLVVLGLVAIFLWLSLRPHRPRLHVISFSVTGLLNQLNGFRNASIVFNVTARNPNRNVDIYYDGMKGNVFYSEQQLGLKTPLLLPFRQPRKNTTYVNGVFTGASLAVTDESWKQVLAGGSGVFRLELTSGIRFKVAKWKTRHRRMDASCVVSVGPDGQIASAYKSKVMIFLRVEDRIPCRVS